MRSGFLAASLLLPACLGLAAQAQAIPAPSAAESPPPVVAPVAAPPAASPLLPVGTPLILEITQALDSKVSKRGDRFTLRLAAPVTLNGQVVIPQGVTGIGQIVDAAPSGAMGRPAKMLLAARYLEFKGAQIPVRGFQLGGAGADKSNTILAASIALGVIGLPVMFLHGGEIVIPAGTLGQAKLGAGVDASGALVAPATPAVPTPSNASPPT